MENNPEEEAKQILEKLRPGGMWEPAGLGLSYIREGATELKLVQQENTPIAAQARVRMRVLVESIGWTIDEEEVSMVDTSHLSPQEKHMHEIMLRQQSAQRWPCPKCETPLVAFPLEQAVWQFDGQQEMRLPDGEIEEVEQWCVIIECPVCDTKVPMEPYDFGLIAGDDLMTTYTNEVAKFIVMSRMEVIQKVDAKSSDVIILGTFCPFSGSLLPPHVRGTNVTWSELADKGEEE
jgi:hypothetical protein